MVEKRTNKVLDRLPSWWRKDLDSNTYGLVKSFAFEYGAISNESYKMQDEVYVNTSTGSYLDALGRIFKLSRRAGETDSQFRTRIIAYWPGFSGGGTKDAIVTTINKITGVPTSDIAVTEIPDELKINVDVVLTTPESLTLIPTLEQVIWAIKAAGVYPFITWVINGTMTEDLIDVTDSVSIAVVPTDDFFRWELSLIEGEAVLT